RRTRPPPSDQGTDTPSSQRLIRRSATAGLQHRSARVSSCQEELRRTDSCANKCGTAVSPGRCARDAVGRGAKAALLARWLRSDRAYDRPMAELHTHDARAAI